MKRLAVLAGILTLAMAMPAGAEPLFDPKPFDSFKVGTTKRADVVNALGKPVDELPGRGTDRVVFYEYRTNDPATPNLTVVMVFSEKGVLKIVRFYKKTD